MSYIFEKASPHSIRPASGPQNTPAMEAFLAYEDGTAAAQLAPQPGAEIPVVAEVSDFFERVHDALETGTNHPGWVRGLYPTAANALAAYESGSLFLLREADGIAGVVILNHDPEEAYSRAEWGAELSYDDVLVVHTLAIHPEKTGRGLGALMMQKAEEYARQTGIRAMRLDAWEHNAPANRLYPAAGYVLRGTVDFGLERPKELRNFHLYEKLL